MSVQTSDKNHALSGARRGPSKPVGPSSTTTPGFRNLRVLIPEELHWKLRDFAIQSRMPFQRYIVSWLGEAFPLTPPGGSGNQEVEGWAPAPGPEGPHQGGQPSAPGTGASHGMVALADQPLDPGKEIPDVLPILGGQAGPPHPGLAVDLASAGDDEHA